MDAPQVAKLRIGIVQNANSESMGDVCSDPQMEWRAEYTDGTPIPAGTKVSVPQRVFAGYNVVAGTTFPLLDTAHTGASPLYSTEIDPLQATALDGPRLPRPARTQPNVPVFPPRVLVFDDAGRLVGRATYTTYEKALRKITFTAWCALVEANGDQQTVLGVLAQNEWSVDLDTSVGNQKASPGGASHGVTQIPVLSGTRANAAGRELNVPVAEGAATVELVK